MPLASLLSGEAVKATLLKWPPKPVPWGEKIRGRQVTFELPGGRRTRPDTFTDTPAGGGLKVCEAKNGPTARLTPGQEELQDLVGAGGTVIPRGRRSADAGLTPGVPINIRHYEEDRF
jgi:hypothetical protein